MRQLRNSFFDAQYAPYKRKEAMTDDLKRLINIIEEQFGNIQLVSYGLAPNPKGFCFELYDPDLISESELTNFCYLLHNLTRKEEEILKRIYF